MADVLRIGKHTRFTDIPLIISPILFPLDHVIEPSGKFLASNALNELLAAVTGNFD